jgi:acyl carrier protein
MALSQTEVLAGLAKIVNEETGLDTSQVQMEKSFVDDLDIDSISMLTIVMNAEEHFGVTIPEEKVADLKTVADAVNFITVVSGFAEIVNQETGLDTSQVQMEKSFKDDLGIDSTSMLKIFKNAAKKFGVTIPDEEVADLETVADAVNFITEAL